MLALRICVRMNQRNRSYKNKRGERTAPRFSAPVSYDRTFLIQISGLQKTNKQNRSLANKKLSETLKRMKDLNIIAYLPKVPVENVKKVPFYFTQKSTNSFRKNVQKALTRL